MKSHFKFNKKERSGIFFLLLLVLIAQLVYLFGIPFFSTAIEHDPVKEASLIELQRQIDSLKNLKQTTTTSFPFNPNYISDFKGYQLGMSVAEIDRLLAFRAQNKFVNSASEFQEVTQVSDSLLASMSGLFKFPEWVNIPKKSTKNIVENKVAVVPDYIIGDLNIVDEPQLKKISGIGETLSKRIVKFRDRLGGFLINDQLYDVYGLDSAVAQKVLARYTVVSAPIIQKIDINLASAYEISSIVYINYEMAKKIVAFRSENGPFTSIDQLREISDFPIDKISRIELYLTFN
jgi:DNA uptake protein ComE-like DNA-binding protein